MVNQNIVKYLKEGKKRGFSVNLLKQKLLQGGFSEKDVDEAINVGGGGTGMKTPTQKAVMPTKTAPIKQTTPQQPFRMNKAGSGKWLRIGGWCGIFLIILPLLYFLSFIVFFSQGMPTTNNILSIVFSLCMLILILLYLFGFVKLGKTISVRKISLGAWILIGTLITNIIYSVILFFIFKEDFVSLMMNPTNVFLIFGIWSLIFLVGVVGQFVFSFGLLDAGEKIRFEKATGILNMIVSILIVVGIIGLVISIVALRGSLSDSLGAGGLGGDFGGGGLGASGFGGSTLSPMFSPGLGLLMFMGGMMQIAALAFIGTYITRINALILEIFVLFDASKKY